MNNFEFVLPTRIVYAAGSVKMLAAELSAAGSKKPLIVTDAGIVKAGLFDLVANILHQAGCDYVAFCGVEANPKDVNVEEGARIARANAVDAIVALGGGSPIDCAKSIGVLLAHHAEKIKPFEGRTKAVKPQPFFVAIPTTAGTGSEVTFSSVITDSVNHYKMTVKGPHTAPNVALCDPALTLSVPPAITAATGLDALTHAIEGYTVNCSEPIGDATALHAVELICRSLVSAYRQGDNLQARDDMLMGSLLAGIAFSHADVASVHCVAEALGSVYDLPHGVCNAVFLPYVMEYNMGYCQERYSHIAKAMGFSFGTASEGAALAIDHVKKLTRELNLPPFASLVPSKEKFDVLAAMSENNGSNASNPRLMSKEDYLAVLQRAHAGL